MPNIPVCPPEVAPKESVVDSPAMTDTESLFIPLGDAAAVVHKEATGETTTDTRVLEELAASIAMNVVIYAREGWGPNMQMVRPEVLHHAEFQQGGNVIRSRNVTYGDPCLRRSKLAAVIELLIQLHKKNET